MIANLLKFERPGLEPIPLNPLNAGNFGQAVPRINLPATGGKTPTPIIARMPEPANISRDMTGELHQLPRAEAGPVEVVEPAAVVAPSPSGSMIANLLKFERPGLEPIPQNPVNAGNFGQDVPRINLPATIGKTPAPTMARTPEPANSSRDRTGELHRLPRAEAGPVEVVEPAAVTARAPAGTMIANILNLGSPRLETIPRAPMDARNVKQAVVYDKTLERAIVTVPEAD